jgi:hypothetical protein
LPHPAGASRNPLRFEPLVGLFAGEGSAVAIADLNGDGRKDIVYGGASNNPENPFRLFVFTQQADGTLGSPVGYQTHSGTRSLAVGDLDGDKRTDVAVTGGRGIDILLQRGRRLAGPTLMRKTKGALLLEIADMNGDRRKDLVYTVSGGGIRIAQKTRRGFAISTVWSAPRYTFDFEVGDVTGDGRNVIVAVWDPTFAVLRQRRDRTFASPVVYPAFYGLGGVEVADVTGDGRKDVSIALAVNSPTWIRVYRQNAAGGLNAPANYDSFQVPE